jgi:hypothetical protein
LRVALPKVDAIWTRLRVVVSISQLGRGCPSTVKELHDWMSGGWWSLFTDDLLELHSLISSLLLSLLRRLVVAGSMAKGLSGGRLAGAGRCRRARGTRTAADRTS